MVSVVGGFYREQCIYPHWDEYFGSGGRATIALCGLGIKPTFFTYASNEMQIQLCELANTYGFHLSPTKSELNISFSYYHGLSTPSISPAKIVSSSNDQIELSDEFIIRFGMLEGDAVVDGEYVVYDPQNVENPTSFSRNGSTAQHLAIVLNRHEATTIAGFQAAPEVLAKHIAEKEKAEVVILKMGSFGALVHTEAITSHIPCYETESVWPIGSGDIFATYFAYFWMLKKFSPLAAADHASRATAFYCWTKGFPLVSDLNRTEISTPIRSRNQKYQARNPVLYLAGPFFTLGQRWMVDQAREALLSSNMDVFSPLHDVGHGPAEQVVQHDIDAIMRADLMFAIVDGLDSGTLFEIGYARSLGIPVMAYCENEKSEDLKMLKGSGCLIVHDFVTAIYKTNWLLSNR